jgi:hypothetical protein
MRASLCEPCRFLRHLLHNPQVGGEGLGSDAMARLSLTLAYYKLLSQSIYLHHQENGSCTLAGVWRFAVRFKMLGARRGFVPLTAAIYISQPASGNGIVTAFPRPHHAFPTALPASVKAGYLSECEVLCRITAKYGNAKQPQDVGADFLDSRIVSQSIDTTTVP